MINLKYNPIKLIKYFFKSYLGHKKSTLGAYLVISLLANFLIFPFLGIKVQPAFAENNLDEAEILLLTNKAREDAGGIAKLNLNPILSSAASKKADNMFEEDYWAHFGPNGESPWVFIREEGYEYIYAGENLAKNFKSNQDLHTAWMNSEAHKKNILDPRFNEIGISVKEGNLAGEDTVLVVVMFGTPLENNNTEVLETPNITSPEDGQQFDINEIELKGIIYEGDTVRVIRNNEIVGELPNSSRAFTTNLTLINGENKIELQSLDKDKKAESGLSKEVNVIYNSDDDDDEFIVGANISTPISRLTSIFKFNIPNLFNLFMLLLILAGVFVETRHLANNKKTHQHHISTFFGFSFPLLIVTLIYFFITI